MHSEFAGRKQCRSKSIQLKEKLCSILQMDDDFLTRDMMVVRGFSVAQYLKQAILDKKGSGRLNVIGRAIANIYSSTHVSLLA